MKPAAKRSPELFLIKEEALHDRIVERLRDIRYYREYATSDLMQAVPLMTLAGWEAVKYKDAIGPALLAIISGVELKSARKAHREYINTMLELQKEMRERIIKKSYAEQEPEYEEERLRKKYNYAYVLREGGLLFATQPLSLFKRLKLRGFAKKLEVMGLPAKQETPAPAQQKAEESPVAKGQEKAEDKEFMRLYTSPTTSILVPKEKKKPKTIL
jgi:hypothetical protein